MRVLKSVFSKTGRFALYVFFILVCLFFLLRPEQAANAVFESVSMWAFKVMPVSLTFLIASNMLLSNKKSSKRAIDKGFFITLYLTGLIIASPASIANISSLYSEKKISLPQAIRLLALLSNMSPIFMYVTVGSFFFHSFSFGLKLVIINYVSCIVTYIIVCAFNIKEYKGIPKVNADYYENTTYTNPVRYAVDICLNIGGYMAFFGLISSGVDIILNKAPFEVKSFISCALEVTNGLHLLSTASCFNKDILFIIASCACGFGGVSYMVFIAIKLLCAAVSLCISVLFVIVFPS